MTLFTTKSIADLRADAESNTLRRALGPLNLTTLGIGSIIGTGIFVLTGTAASQNAGPGLVISMIIAGIACGFAGLCYAEFASMIPVAGSAYTYAYATMGELMAWIIGWDLVLEYALSAATVAVGWSGYFSSLLGDFGVRIPAALAGAPGETVAMGSNTAPGIFNLPAALIIILVTTLLVIGIRQSANTNTVLVVIKSMVLVVFVVAGAAYVNRANLTPLIPANTGSFGQFGWSGVLRGAGVMFFAYIGFDAVSTAAQEAKNPQRDMPIGILGSLASCTVIYVAVALVLTGIIKYTNLNVAHPVAYAVENVAGLHWLTPFITIGAVLGLGSVVLVMLLGQSRVFYSMSRDGLMGPWAGKVHPKYRTPYLSTIYVGLIVAVITGTFPIQLLGELVNIGTLLAFVLVCAGVLILRRTRPDLDRPFRTPLVPLVPILGILACFGLMATLPGDTWLRLLVWLLIGFVIYFSYGRKHSHLQLEIAARQGKTP